MVFSLFLRIWIIITERLPRYFATLCVQSWIAIILCCKKKQQDQIAPLCLVCIQFYNAEINGLSLPVLVWLEYTRRHCFGPFLWDNSPSGAVVVVHLHLPHDINTDNQKHGCTCLSVHLAPCNYYSASFPFCFLLLFVGSCLFLSQGRTIQNTNTKSMWQAFIITACSYYMSIVICYSKYCIKIVAVFWLYCRFKL